MSQPTPNLQRANEIRCARARIHAELKQAGPHVAPAQLARLLTNPPEALHGAQIGDVLTWLPRGSADRVDALLDRHGIHYATRVGSELSSHGTLTHRQRHQLVRLLTP